MKPSCMVRAEPAYELLTKDRPPKKKWLGTIPAKLVITHSTFELEGLTQLYPRLKQSHEHISVGS